MGRTLTARQFTHRACSADQRSAVSQAAGLRGVRRLAVGDTADQRSVLRWHGQTAPKHKCELISSLRNNLFVGYLTCNAVRTLAPNRANLA